MGTIIPLHPKPDNKRLWLFLAIVFVLLLGIALTGCVTEKAYKRITAECPTAKDSTDVKTITKIIPHDSLIYITSDPLILDVSNPCDSIGHLKKFDYKKKEHGINMEVLSRNDSLIEICNVDSFKEVVRGLNIERILYKEAFEERLRTTNVCHETWLQTTYKWGFWLLLVILLGGLAIKYFLKSIKFP